MEVSYSADIDHIDEPLLEAAAERPGLPLRVRIQPSLFRKPAGRTEGQQWAWKGVSWTIECPTTEEAVALREAMRTFFDAVGDRGPAVVRHRLALLMDETK